MTLASLFIPHVPTKESHGCRTHEAKRHKMGIAIRLSENSVGNFKTIE
jgi:hypothetical protein